MAQLSRSQEDAQEPEPWKAWQWGHRDLLGAGPMRSQRGQDGWHLCWEQGRSVDRVGCLPHSERQGADPEMPVQLGGTQASPERLTRQCAPTWCSRPSSDQRTRPSFPSCTGQELLWAAFEGGPTGPGLPTGTPGRRLVCLSRRLLHSDPRRPMPSAQGIHGFYSRTKAVGRGLGARRAQGLSLFPRRCLSGD